MLYHMEDSMKTLKRILSYLLVFTLGLCSAVMIFDFFPASEQGASDSKLEQLAELIETHFIGQADRTAMEDAAAGAMVASLGDEWSYYISAADYQAYMEQMRNAYVGVGITISVREDGYLDVRNVESGGPADRAGIQPGDILVAVDGSDCAELGLAQTRDRVRGEEGTTVSLTIKRAEQELTMAVERAYFQTPVATWEMVDTDIALIQIENFDERCADETLQAIEQALSHGAKKLIFDVRNNPGGYKDEMVEVLDYLLPEGPLFRSESYDGTEEVDESDASFLDVPMAVLVNSESYSAAEFFAAALSEYDAAIVVGTQTYGKGYYQVTFRLNDGSAVGLSVGKYYTPNGVSLAGVGITPDVPVEVDDEMFLDIYYAMVEPLEDPQVLAAIDALKQEN